jgi:hypothetical protein
MDESEGVLGPRMTIHSQALQYLDDPDRTLDSLSTTTYQLFRTMFRKFNVGLPLH